METEEVIKLVDGIYKNILDKFNPGARQLISAGKAYLKALHGTASASRVFNEALAKIAVNAQQGGTTDIGSALMNIVGVYKEIQDQHMNILKAFYVDLLVPLETNLEKDTKVVQFEQKKFMQLHKVRSESFQKAAATMKKQRKKKPNPQNADKEIKSIQAVEEEKSKMDQFCEQSLKNAMTQERRRYGFVLERQCSLAKHWMAYHTAGKVAIEESMDNWQDVASTREFLPPNVDSMFGKRSNHHQQQHHSNMHRIDHFSEDEEDDDDDDDRISISSQMRKTKSIDASCLDMKSLGEVANHMPRAKSEYSLTTNAVQPKPPTTTAEVINWDQRPMVRALYAYLSSGENQLSFLEGDQIALVGDRAKGWQFGENLRTQQFGWFPIAYTGYETSPTAAMPADMNDPMLAKANHGHSYNGLQTYLEQQQSEHMGHMSSSMMGQTNDSALAGGDESFYGVSDGGISPSARMFGDTLMYRPPKQYRGMMMHENGHGPQPGPPPTLPAPVPNASAVPSSAIPSPAGKQLSQSQSFSSSLGAPMVEKRPKSIPATINFTKQNGAGQKMVVGKGGGGSGVTNASLHSSNDSGFAIEPPPQPEVDYSDEDTLRRVPIRSNANKYDGNRKGEHSNKNRASYPAQPGGVASKLNGTLESKAKRNTMIRQSSSHGNLADDSTMDLLYNTGDRGQVKRTKSFWKFGKSDTEDIVEGMAMWKHRDLIQPENDLYYEEEKAAKESTMKRNKNSSKDDQQQKHKTKTMEKKADQKRTPSNSRVKEMQQNITVPIIDDHAKYQLTKSEIDQRVGKTKERYYQEEQQPQQQPQSPPQGGKSKKIMRESETELGYAEDEDDMLTIEDSLDEKPINNQQPQQQQQNMRMKAYETNHNLNNKSANNRKYYDEMDLEDERFYDDESIAEEVMVMKTVKRKEILKQYYSSGTSDTERHSSSSDPYDCIVVQDHHLMRNQNNIYNNNSNNRKNNKNKEMTTFRSEFAMNQKNLDLEQQTILPRTKLVKNASAEPGNKMQKEQFNDTQQKKSKKEQNVEPKSNNNNGGGKRKNFEEAKRNSMSSAKSYGPWYDLWGANPSQNGTNNNTLISQK